MMTFFRKLVYLTLLHLVTNQLQINLDLTDWTNASGNNDVLQHDCLHIASRITTLLNPYQIISYCMSESPSKWNIQKINFDQNFTFAELYNQNITSQQLYRWSAPMDIVENYQFYLDQLSISKKLPSMSTQLFYNCTSPNFGPLCQYSLDIPMSHYSSLNEMIDEFYRQNYEPTTMTCYTHLHCDRGSAAACLDWAEICDGKIDCLNGGVDEEHCWQLEINECAKNEYRCNDGQCIANILVTESDGDFECVDQSDQRYNKVYHNIFYASAPTFQYEDIRCPDAAFSQITFTSSCVYQRHQLLFAAMFLNKSNSMSDACWFAFRCYFGIPDSLHPRCHDICLNKTCKQIINESCPDLFYIPNIPIVFGHIYLAYTKKAALESIDRTLPPSYICYDNRLCDGFSSNKTVLSFNNTTCRRPEHFPLIFSESEDDSWMDIYLTPIFKQLYKCKTIMNNNSAVCNSSIMYQCINSSKCISKYRIGDGLSDCDYGDDEEEKIIYDICLKFQPTTLFQCTTINKCIHRRMIKNDHCDCGCDEDGFCDDETLELNDLRRHTSFRYICDSSTDLLPITVDGRNETDETECELWQCNNTYTRCDGIWNCLNGADEVDCEPSSSLQCPLHHHICISIEKNQPICLPIEKANDGKIDCLEAADEPKLCQSNNDIYNQNNIDCQNHTFLSSIKCLQLCYETSLCKHDDVEQFCYKLHNFTAYDLICNENYKILHSNVEKIRRRQLSNESPSQTVQLSLDDRRNSAPITNTIMPFSSLVNDIIQYKQSCHRGIPLRVWIDREKNLTATTCLCPPSFYGDICQYQNQRVSLTLKFQAHSDSLRTVLAIVVSLIDDSKERSIHSYRQFSYLYIRDCTIKSKIYLLYSTRPKNYKKNYSVHIDIYEKISLTYRGSFLLPLKFPFLPVHRIAVHLNIPYTGEKVPKCTNQQCVHGKCIRYSEDFHGTTFCHCNQGWSGQYCNIPHTCTCSLGSLCVGISANNRSICVCPLNKFGSRCLLHNIICQSNQSNTCYNGGTCIPADENVPSTEEFFCICPKGFTGFHCEIPDTKIIVSFHKDIELSRSMIVHFVQTMSYDIPRIGTTFQTISIYQNIIILHWPDNVDIILMQIFDKNLYMIVNPYKYNRSAVVESTIDPSDRCKHISEVLNETIVNLHLIRRIKYYHVPCQKTLPSLPCFYDDNQFCMCNNFGHQRLADCFEFDSRKKLDCFGQNYCENGAQCLQDQQYCPTMSACVCLNCFYGTRCQFSSSLFGLSLDAILGYHIQPHMNISQQPSIVQVSVALTIIITIAGLLNGVLSLMTFKNKEPQDIGCDLYLFGSSITILFTMIMFTLKFWILVVAQMIYSTNRSFLNFQCISIDFLLRIGLNVDQWLSACVAAERAIMTLKGIHFDKKKSRQTARYIILSLLFLTMVTTVHDPICRRLIYDGNDYEEKRIWCIVTYSSGLQVYNSIMNIFHFIVPFIINLLSAIFIIKTTAGLRNRINPQQNHQQILHMQIQLHSRILISPIVLIILAIPRLILSLVSGCMKSIDDAWMFLIGYYISFLPPLLTFIVFVIPSKTYRKKFRKSIRQCRIMIQTRFNTRL